jgi:hypothetical protein
MEAKDQIMIKMNNEMDFFSLIEKKLKKEGFKVLETLPPGRKNKNTPDLMYTTRSESRFSS